MQQAFNTAAVQVKNFHFFVAGKEAFRKLLFRKHMANTVYKDVWIRISGSIVCAYIIDSMGRPESLFQRMTTSYFYVDLLGGFVISLVIWELVRRAAIYLDKKYDWLEQTLVRLAWQLALGMVVPAMISFLLTWLFMRTVWDQDIFQTEWPYNEFFAVLLFIVLINFIYFTLWLFHQKKETIAGGPAAANLDETQKPAAIEVTKGEKIILLPPDTIAYAYLKDGYCYIKTSDDVYITTYALDDLFGLLPEAGFFRANRQMIIHYKACRSYASIEHGKIRAELEPVYKGDCIISQKRAKSFREWISRAVTA